MIAYLASNQRFLDDRHSLFDDYDAAEKITDLVKVHVFTAYMQLGCNFYDEFCN